MVILLETGKINWQVKRAGEIEDKVMDLVKLHYSKIVTMNLQLFKGFASFTPNCHVKDLLITESNVNKQKRVQSHAVCICKFPIDIVG